MPEGSQQSGTGCLWDDDVPPHRSTVQLQSSRHCKIPARGDRSHLLEAHAKPPLANESFDAVCMFSVIAHQAPSEAAAILSLIRSRLRTQHLYFTVIVSTVDGYAEADRANPRLLSTYNTALIETLVRDAGWRLEQVYEPSPVHQTAFVCSPK
ncbi:class I SAM-dependent methyltransferase [Mesorhizobium sp. WSM4312]|uniref:class I SAM-dependent methyltransferase n=1 Tax=Mesorhizobium sp. WSM4312 TaxID=2029411 RepID=UPI0015CBA2DD|nr:class I SAM-dependent methyltransferase [Mesorhizobium sp. WSM4312]